MSIKRENVFDGCLRENAVAKIEDMARPPRRLRQDAPGLGFDFAPGREQDHGIEIALNGDIITESSPPFLELDSPIEADD